MVNVYIYLRNAEDAEQLAVSLLKRKLIAHASIDKDNTTVMYENDEIRYRLNYVLTAQTRALLFNAVVDYVQEHYSDHIKIYSLPITQCNKAFADVIREHTKPTE